MLPAHVTTVTAMLTVRATATGAQMMLCARVIPITVRSMEQTVELHVRRFVPVTRFAHVIRIALATVIIAHAIIEAHAARTLLSQGVQGIMRHLAYNT